MFVGDSHDDGGPNGVDIVATRCLTEVLIIATMVDRLGGGEAIAPWRSWRHDFCNFANWGTALQLKQRQRQRQRQR